MRDDTSLGLSKNVVELLMILGRGEQFKYQVNLQEGESGRSSQPFVLRKGDEVESGSEEGSIDDMDDQEKEELLCC